MSVEYKLGSSGNTSVNGRIANGGEYTEIYAPWREKTIQKNVKAAKVKDRVIIRLTQSKCTMQNWLPCYWWTYYDSKCFPAHLLSSSTDDRLIHMLPLWVQYLLVSVLNRYMRHC